MATAFSLPWPCVPAFPQPPPPHRAPLSQVTGREGQAGLCHLATHAWPWALSREGLGFPDRDQVSAKEKEERKTKKREVKERLAAAGAQLKGRVGGGGLRQESALG